MNTRLTNILAAATAVVMISGSSAMALTTQGLLPTGWTGVGGYGSGTPDGDMAAPPSNPGYQYVTSTGGVSGVGSLPGIGGPGTGNGNPTNGSIVTTSIFSALAGAQLVFDFNFMTSDGAGWADYAWARLLDSSDNEVALLFTARTTPGGDTVPGFGMPVPGASLVPASTPIIDNETTWSALGGSSGTCWDTGCGQTGWIQSTFTIENAGNYKLQFGVTNWGDTLYDSAMAVAGAVIDGKPIDPGVVPLPASFGFLAAGMAGIGFLRRRKA